MAYMLVRIEMEPTLPAFVPGAAVPGNSQRLHPPVRKFDEILLQGLKAERVLHLECFQRAVRPIGFHVKLAVPFGEARRHAEIVEIGVVEIAKNSLIADMRHGMGMLRGTPKLALCLVAGDAGLATDEA